MIKKSSIESVFATVRIEDIVEEFVPLKKKGRDYVGLCPFHDDKNPSMHVSPQKGIYKCFVCDAGGGPIDFLMKLENMSYPEAIEHIAKKYGIPLEYERTESDEERKERTLRDSLLTVNEFAEKFFIEQLRNTEEGRLMGLAYLKERGFKDATIDKFKLGYCPEGWDNFTQAALKAGYKEEYLIELGLTGKSQNGKLYDIYRGRVIFPIQNDAGRTIGFGGRILNKTKDPRKYLNSRENAIYHKSDTLYGLYLAKNAIHKQENVYLVEGYTDVISMHESGVENVVASSGTSLTAGQIRMIMRRTKNITVLYDGDMAGIKASLRGIDMLLEQGLKIRVCLLPDGEDPDSFAKKHRDSELQEYLKTQSKDFLFFKTEILSQDAGNDPVKRSEMVNEILFSISCIKDEIERAFYIKECAKLFSLQENVLNNKLREITWKKINSRPRTGQEQQQTNVIPPIPINIAQNQNVRGKIDPLFEAEKNLISLLLNYGNMVIYTTNDEGKPTPTRVDQFVCDEMCRDDLRFHYKMLGDIFVKYTEMARYILNQDRIIKNLTLSEEPEIRNFVVGNIAFDEVEYSEHWKEKFDIHTHTVKNNIRNLQNEVQNILLTLKLRNLEYVADNIRLQVEDTTNSPEDIELMLFHLNNINKAKKNISQLLNRVINR